MKLFVGFFVALMALGSVQAAVSKDSGSQSVISSKVRIPENGRQEVDRIEAKDLGYVTGSDLDLAMQSYLPKIQSMMDCQRTGGSFWSLQPKYEVPVELIVNIGKVLWSIIEKGQPVYQETYNVATGLPPGTQCWNELSGWKRPVMKRFEYRFFAGTSYTKLTMAVLTVAGGKKAGKGKYIAYASAFTESMKNYGLFNKFSINVAVPAVFNEGDDTEPMAAMLMTLRVANDSPLVDRVEGKAIHISGTGAIELTSDDVTP